MDRTPSAIGEVSLTGRWRGVTTDLPIVLVVKNPVRSLILGADWILWSGSHVHPQDGKLVCSVYRPLQWDRASIQQDQHEEIKSESIVELSEDTAPSEQPESLAVGVEDEGESAVSDIETEETPSWEENQQRLEPFGSVNIPPKTLGFIPAKVPAGTGETWLTATTSSARPGREWVIPRSLLKAENSVVQIPVFNIGHRVFERFRLNQIIVAEEVQVIEEPSQNAVRSKENVVGSITEGSAATLPDLED